MIPKDFTWCYLDHPPKVPENLLTCFNEFNDNSPMAISFIKRENGLTDMPRNADYKRYHITDTKLLTWLQFNITPTAIDFGAAFDYANDGLPIDHLPHTDYTRNYTVNYILDTGGDDVITSFYREQGQPLVRDADLRVRRWDNLELIESVKLEPRRWLILNARIIHGVTNITSPRISIHVSLGEEEVCKSLQRTK